MTYLRDLGLTFNSQIYRSWQAMKERCTLKTNINYHRYGGRGIAFDPKWETFLGFYQDMKEGWAPDLTIERKDSNGNYTKENCRWATRAEQGRNSAHTKLTLEQVTEIRRLYGLPSASMKRQITMEKLGEQFGVTKRCIGLIINRKTWNV